VIPVRGFTIIEMVVAMAVMLAVTAGTFAAVQSAPEITLAQSEAADMQQRVRVAVDSIVRDAIAATLVRPCRWGGPSQDPPGTFRTDVITFESDAGTKTYWLLADQASETYQLTQWAGGASADAPVVDHVVALQFAYFGEGESPLASADLAGLRSVSVVLRVQAAAAAVRGPAGPFFVHAGTARTARRWAPDIEVRFRVSPRNLNLER
jgi:prepilin-type N-terminal cleavage/methylation domain-containing protein